MGEGIAGETNGLSTDLEAIAKAVETTAIARRGNELALLELLRLLEQLHSHIRDEWFQEALPNNRQRLYAFLRDIEVHGGWPYIQRMRLRSLLEQLAPEESDPPPADSEAS